MLNQEALEAAYAAVPADKRDMNLIASAVRAYTDAVIRPMEARDEIIRLMREEYDPHPSYELPAGQWDDNAEDVAHKIMVAALSESRLHISDAWAIVKKWLADYAEEEATFSRYRDDVMLDGVMTAGERRRLSDALSGAWTRDDLAIGLAMLDGITLHEIRSTVGDPQDANNWREYLARADDLLAHLSVASARPAATPAPDERALIVTYLRRQADRHGQATRYSGDARSFARTVLKEVALDLEAGEHLPAELEF